MSVSKNRVRIARNFIKTYGRGQFHWFLTAIAKNKSGQEIADHFNVSRERVRQWKNTFGVVHHEYRIHPTIRSILAERKPKR